ncbi:nucleolar protein 8 [Syngnathus scovelli]|uniref:nucleolar protein 8 n=1 Tax=Syngnathus scovelli TaxID=161590 RepID=UPI0021103E08|nr:nucleolar protein 8 isoform X1 [Syngnathus scovelli]
MPRLYVGGLSHSVTQKDLTDRFGNFGNVEDVELRTRRDDEGVPYKTFAYINLNISDTDLKKCMSVLNKSKWKGGTLQIELAKESFLQKLARERQAEQQRLRQNADDTHQREHKLLESLREAGVINFTMKAAVPGTEVPGHKDWVVSKFGRVLPVMQLLCQKGAKARTIKYDPSKHSHNIRRLAPPTSIADPPTPVAQLTWRIDGGDDDISKKRRGEFPPYQPPKPKKARTDATKAGNDARSAQVVSTAEPENRHLLNRSSPADNRPPAQRNGHARSVDSDSDEELRRLVALEQTLQAPGEDPQDNLEVVGHDFKCGGRPTNNQDEDDYDSADTDELVTSRKHPLCPRENTHQESSLADLHKVAEKCQQSSDRRAQKRPTGKAILPEDVLASLLRGGEDPPEFKKVAKTEFKKVAKTKFPAFLGTATLYEEVLEKTDSAQNKTDQPNASLLSSSESKAAKRKIKDKKTKATAVLPQEDKDNVTRLELSVVNLQKVAEECQQSSDRRAPKKPTGKAIMPEDVLASILRGGEDPPEFKKVTKTKYPPFRGTATLYEEELEKTDSAQNKTNQPDGSLSSSSESKAAAAKSKIKRTNATAVRPQEDKDNVTRLELSLVDLPKVAEECQQTSDRRAPKKPTGKAILPEDVLASILRGGEDPPEFKKVTKTKFPAFRGTATLYDEVLEKTDSAQNKTDQPDASLSSSSQSKAVAAKSKIKRTKATAVRPQEDKDNVTRLELSLVDLPKVAEECQQNSDRRAPKKPTGKAIMPEDILASLLKGGEDPPEFKKVTKTKYPPFRGTATLYDEVLEKTDSAQNKTDQPDASLSSQSKAVAAKSKIKRTKATAVLNEEDEDNELAEECQKSSDRRARKKLTKQAILPKDVLKGNSGKDQAESNKKTGTKVAATKSPTFPGQATLHEEALEKTNAAQNKTDQPDASLSSSSANEAAAAARRSKLSAREEKERQEKDNSRRLAAVQQKLKEAEQHQKLIQGALANLDTTTTRAGKHIVFDSEDDDDEHTTEAASETSAPRGDPSKEAKSMPTKKRVRARASAPRLFDSSEDEEDADDEEDGGRFHIRPQFEGLAGKKLMELQSRFGTDERFRMDSRFLEEEEEEEEDKNKEGNRSVAGEEDLLQEEKKRNISILQGLLGPQAHSAKPSTKAKTFRDVSALHYDPSRDEHAAFESKADSNQDSKPARRKKREEAAKLPEVSKEIFYHVSGDLKAMFESATDLETAKQSQTCWDQKAEEGEKHEEQPAQEPSGFMFSFFGDDIQTSNDQKEYKVELIQGAKVASWQLDPRLQDSSEEDEDEDEDQAHEGQSKEAPKTTMEESVSATNNFFFFGLDDSRLTEGPVWFCRSSQLEEEREEWDERQMALRQEYRKKHKDARKKLKSSQKTRVQKS